MDALERIRRETKAKLREYERKYIDSDSEIGRELRRYAMEERRERREKLDQQQVVSEEGEFSD